MQAITSPVKISDRTIEMMDTTRAAVPIPPLYPLFLEMIARIRPAMEQRGPMQGMMHPAIARMRPIKARLYPAGLGSEVAAGAP